MADRLVVLGRGGVIGHGTIREALAGDWLSASFETRVNIVEHQGVHLWRPALEDPGHAAIPAQPGIRH